MNPIPASIPDLIPDAASQALAYITDREATYREPSLQTCFHHTAELIARGELSYINQTLRSPAE